MLLLHAWLSLLSSAAPSIDPQALEQHLDEVVPARMEDTGVPGVVVSVVQGDQVLLAKGWGLADVEHRTPMDGEHTVVRVASISKTFTATAVAQLEARGQLELDVPVERYLPGLRLTDDRITLRHLLGHTAGLINNNVGRVARDAPTESLGTFLETTMPPVLRPPGTAVVYCNHGNALAGWVVELRSGQPFAEYVDEHILGPLRMDDSSFVLEPRLEQALATGYTLDGGEPEPYEYLHFKTVPASTLHTTAADMAHAMVMHLSDGRFEDRTVLEPQAAQRMRSAVAGIHPALPTYHYAFAHSRVAGHPARSHGGSVPGFLSRVALFDEQGVGVFVAQNSLDPSLTAELVTSVAERFLPEPSWPAVVAVGDGRPEDPSRLVGDYRRLGKGDTPAFTRGVAVLAGSSFSVGIDGEGYLVVDGDRFVRTGPLTFHRERKERAPQALVFVEDEDGRVRWMHRGLSSAERPPWHARRWVQLPWLGLALLILGAAALRRRGECPRSSVLAARLGLLAFLGSHLYVAWVDAGQVAYLRPLRFGLPAWLAVVRWLVPLAAVLAWLGVGAAWRAREPDRRMRGMAMAVAVAAGALVLWTWYWHTPPPGLLGPP